MNYSIAKALLALALFSLCSQGLSWTLILHYSQPGGTLAYVGVLSAAGAFGLAIGQCINVRLLFAMGSHRLIALASALLVFVVLPGALLSAEVAVHMGARWLLGGIDGMMFLVIENACVVYAPAQYRAQVLAAYLFTLYAMQLFSPFLAAALLHHNIYIFLLMLLSAVCAPCVFYFTPTFLTHQIPSQNISLGERQFIRQGLLGAVICVLSGILLPIWTAFIPSYLQIYPQFLTQISALFLCGGLVGQVLVMILKKYVSSLHLVYMLLVLGLSTSLLLLSPLTNPLPHLCSALFVLALSLYPLYGLGLDLALELINPALWVRANQTLLSCYTLPAILFPLCFPFISSVSLIALPLMTAVGLLVVLCILPFLSR